MLLKKVEGGPQEGWWWSRGRLKVILEKVYVLLKKAGEDALEKVDDYLEKVDDGLEEGFR